jgi:hypothetical protein
MKLSNRLLNLVSTHQLRDIFFLFVVRLPSLDRFQDPAAIRTQRPFESSSETSFRTGVVTVSEGTVTHFSLQYVSNELIFRLKRRCGISVPPYFGQITWSGEFDLAKTVDG